MSSHLFKYLLPTVILFIAIAMNGKVSATPILFDDFGNETLDKSTQLIWLDLTETVNRSYTDVLCDIQDCGAEVENNFIIDSGWRFATKSEFQELISNWFDVEYNGGWLFSSPFGWNTDSLIVEDFIHTFGDTYDYHVDLINNGADTSPTGAGYLLGFLEEVDVNGFQTVGKVYDGETVYRDSGLPIENNLDTVDYVRDNDSYSSFGENVVIGSFLVRNAVSVSEPPSLFLFLSIFIFLLIRRISCISNLDYRLINLCPRPFYGN